MMQNANPDIATLVFCTSRKIPNGCKEASATFRQAAAWKKPSQAQHRGRPKAAGRRFT